MNDRYKGGELIVIVYVEGECQMFASIGTTAHSPAPRGSGGMLPWGLDSPRVLLRAILGMTYSTCIYNTIM